MTPYLFVVVALASDVSSPETLGMSQIVRVRSTEVAVRSSAGIPRVYRRASGR